MNAQIVHRFGGPFLLFGQELASGSISVPELVLELGRLGVTQQLMKDYQQLRLLLDRKQVRLVIGDETYKDTVGIDDALKEAATVLVAVAPLLVSDATYGVDINTRGALATEDPAVGVMRLSTNGLVIQARDANGHADSLNRSRPMKHSTGVVYVEFDASHVFEGDATVGNLPGAGASHVGRFVAIANRQETPLVVPCANDDTVDGETSFTIEPGAKAVFEVVDEGDWQVWG